MANPQEGWIKLWRKSLESQVFQDSDLWKVWTWCLMKASHKEIWIPVTTGRGLTQVKLEPGQFIFGRFESAKELKMKASTLRDRVLKLKNIGNLDIQPDTHFSIISIMNWSAYQEEENKIGQANRHPTDTQPTPNRHPTDTNKNVKNVKNKEIYSSFFLTFWQNYPKKVGKLNSFKEWNKIKPDLEIVLPALEAQKNEKERLIAENKFCPEWPDPERWIKNQRWFDEIQNSPPLDETDRMIYEMKKEREK